MFTRINVIDSMKKAVHDYGPEWVDPNATKGGDPAGNNGCTNTYVDEDGEEKHCIAAYILFDLTGADPHETPDVSIDELVFDDFEGRFTREAGQLLRTAQLLQDRGAPWGAILNAAKMKGI